VSIRRRAVRVEDEKAGTRPAPVQGGIAVTQYLLSIYQPDEGTPAPDVLAKIMEGVGAWRSDLRAAGGWVFTAGLQAPGTAAVVRFTGDGLLTTDGPFTEGKEHIGGFTVIQAGSRDEALDWAGKLARIVTPLSIEVRPLHGGPGD
jgi:hypothetical protein